jgi:hypothetical protein
MPGVRTPALLPHPGSARGQASLSNIILRLLRLFHDVYRPVSHKAEAKRKLQWRTKPSPIGQHLNQHSVITTRPIASGFYPEVWPGRNSATRRSFWSSRTPAATRCPGRFWLWAKDLQTLPSPGVGCLPGADVARPLCRKTSPAHGQVEAGTPTGPPESRRALAASRGSEPQASRKLAACTSSSQVIPLPPQKPRPR